MAVVYEKEGSSAWMSHQQKELRKSFANGFTPSAGDCLNMIELFVPPIIRAILRKHPGKVFLAGGSLRSIFDHTPTNDYDLFFQNEEIQKESYAYTRDKIKQKSAIPIEAQTEWCNTIIGFGTPIQFIYKKQYNNVHEVIQSFDFTCTQWAIYAPEQNTLQLVVGKTTIGDTIHKRLEVNNLSSMEENSLRKRIEKYQQKGYTLSRESWMLCAEHMQKFPSNPPDERVYF